MQGTNDRSKGAIRGGGELSMASEAERSNQPEKWRGAIKGGESSQMWRGVIRGGGEQSEVEGSDPFYL